MQVARGRDLVRPSVRLGMLRAGWPRSKEVEQADAAQQGGGQLDLHHELRQAGGGLIQAHQLF